MAVLMALVSQGGYFFPEMVVLACTLTEFFCSYYPLLLFTYVLVKKHVKSVPLGKTCGGEVFFFSHFN